LQHLCGTGSLATRDARQRQLPADTSHAVPTRECQSDLPSLPRDARHPTLGALSANPRRALTFHSMSGGSHATRTRDESVEVAAGHHPRG
jgi:hypothetical protein